MRERDFLKLYIELYREKGERIPSVKAAKKRIDSMWETIIESLLKEKKVIFKGIGKFELKETRTRNFTLPFKRKGEDKYIIEKRIIPSKKIIRFVPGTNFKNSFN